MSLKEQIQTDLMEAMKARDEVKVSTLRMLKSAVGKFEVSGKEKIESTDDDWMRILKKEAKQRKDSIQQFTDGGRDDLVGPEQAELAILEEYLPEAMGEDQVREIVVATVEQVGATGMNDMGKVMGAVMGKVGAEADGGMVKTIVQSTLNNL
ncbi:GatB/YqeY domain-containing protein [Candidatus Peregrinibacteria bacterium]|jgi:uncharacterized protein|nr:GatB/YqeY domain-containing protein [Candidatus Peregrinibacteria bacterium]MBT7483928.1 GatB/YqeY domain-containing protein [Candidatus Peregrinibacteria bacterium]MBT7702637.1 GatB/YqeY domain-containing protein [Candidatus Peregrinibacteria bacterium]